MNHIAPAFVRFLAYTLAFVAWAVLSPLLFLLLQLTSLLGRLFRKTGHLNQQPLFTGPTRPPCSIVIPNWNGLDLLQRYLPSVIAACNFELGDEIIVVDNASADESLAWLRTQQPNVRVLELQSNLGFGGGCNAGIRAASHSIVVLLNSDMRVEPCFLPPLIEPFREPDVFAVSAQILFTDATKRREESGLTYARFRSGRMELGHQVEFATSEIQPCFYPGGGSSAFHRSMLLELGGFDHLYRPFYLEDTDLGFEAWRRGWRVLYQPASIVYHEHRGTIGKHFTPGYIHSIVSKNRLLFEWKHLHSFTTLSKALARVAFDLLAGALGMRDTTQPATPRALLRCLSQLPELIAARFRASQSAKITDRDALTLHQPDIYFDRYLHQYSPQRPLRILFLSPYPLFPPRHGGAVLITQTLNDLKHHCDIHLVVILEHEHERQEHESQSSRFASLHLIVRQPGTRGGRFGTLPKAVREFDIPELRHLLPQLIHRYRIDVVQLEYTQMAQYLRRYRNILTAVFEHDVYFQTVARRILSRGAKSGWTTILEYFRALRFELVALQQTDYIQVCTAENAALLRRYLPHLSHKLDANLRAGIRLNEYCFTSQGRLPSTLLFVGNFRHTPNREGLGWLIDTVMPLVAETLPDIQLRVVGANCHQLPVPDPLPPWLDLAGEVPEVQPHLQECTIFVCPVLTGSGVRVKLLEAYASGIPVVSTTIGAEGLSDNQTALCELADSPNKFAQAILRLLSNPAQATALAHNARAFVEDNWDAEKNTRRMEQRYRELLLQKQRSLHGKS